MSTTRHTAHTAVALAMTIGMLALAGPSPTQAADDFAAQVTAAKTAADHAALASEYDKMAAAARDKAALHRRMGEAYKAEAGTAIGKGAGVSAMPQHCQKLVAGFEEEAKMYDSMAATERELAKAAK